MPDSFAIFRVAGYRLDYVPGPVIREHCDEVLSVGNLISCQIRTPTEGTLILLDLFRGGGINADHELYVLRFITECFSDFKFPGHTPEISSGTGFRQLDYVGDVFQI